MIIQLLDCPEQCNCRKGFNGLTISCVDSQLKQVIPVIPKDTTELLLSDNLIANISSADFAECFNITKLDLSFNVLAFLRMNYFNDLTNLKYLNLAHNALNQNTSITPGVFARLSKLRTIILNNNNLYYGYTFVAFQAVVKELPDSLEELFIDIPCEEYFAYIFQKFTNLTRLGLFRDEQCQSVLANSSFSLLRKLSIQKLKIRFDRLIKVEQLTFSWLQHLTSLDLSETRGMSVNDFHPAWIGLRNTKLSILSLSSFQQKFVDSDPVILDSIFFKQMNLKYLQELNLDNTNIHRVGDLNLYDKLTNLEKLSLAYNSMGHDQISKLTDYTQVLEKLSHLDLSFQAKSNEPTVIITPSPHLTVLNLSGFTSCIQDHMIGVIMMTDRNNLTLFEFRRNSLTRINSVWIGAPTSESTLLTVVSVKTN